MLVAEVVTSLVLLELALDLITRRFYCRYLCPLGGPLAVLGLRRRLVVVFNPASCNNCRRCDLTCPLGLEPSRGEGSSATCWNCGCCIDACAEGSLSFRWRRPLDPGQRRPDLIQLEKG